MFPLVLVSAWSPPRNHPLQQRQRGITAAPLFMIMKESTDRSISQTQSMAMMPARKGRKRRRRFDELFEGLPRSANAICSNSMVNDLEDGTKELIREYIIERCPGSAEIADALFWVAETHPKELRTKELIETIEAVTLIGASINVLLDSTQRKQSMTIYDLACGHALGGTLLAYRFPEVKVVCIDMERRPCWKTYCSAFEKFGMKTPGNDTVMANLALEVGDITNLKPAQGDYLMSIHGCNDLSPFVLKTALKYRTGFAVMPCCIRDGLLGVSSSSSGRNGGITDDKSRYALQVGYLAGKFGCSRVAAISHVITNRFLIIIGDWSNNHSSEGM